MGKIQLRLLKFAIRFRGWHTMSSRYAPDSAAMYKLVELGLFEIHENSPVQFRLVANP